MKLAIDSMHCTMWQEHNGANLTYDKQIHQYRFVEDMAVSVLRKPSIFVSSTCFDLKQIRADIKTFIENDLGYDVLLSEQESFPINPNISTIDNCLNAVTERADILVLIVGGRYGSIADGGLSVTNMEYLRAHAKGIPIYAFVDKNILSVLPVWRANPSVDFSSVVDTTKLFEFVDSFRSVDGIWTFEFNSATEIISILREQFGILFSNCLNLRQKATRVTLSKAILELDGAALDIALLQPDGWEYRLFSEVLSSGLRDCKNEKYDFIYGIALSPSTYLESQNVIDYIQAKTNDMLRRVDALGTLIRKVLPTAFGDPGVPGDADLIIYAANKFVDVYRSIINWSLEFNTIATEDIYNGLIKAFSQSCSETLNDIELFSVNFERTIVKQLSEPNCEASSEEKITLVLTPPDTGKINEEIKKILAMQAYSGNM